MPFGSASELSSTRPASLRPVNDVAPPAVSVRGARLAPGGRTLFENLSFDLPAGTVTALLGPSGVGKSTLLRLIAGLAAPGEAASGVVGTVAASDGAPLRGRIAWMAQQDLLAPWLTVLDNAMLGERLRGTRRRDLPVDRAMEVLAAVGLADRARERPAGLSGGERQRAALARTLMENRPVVLMDEPFSALDAVTRLKLQDLAARLLAGRTVLLVTHDPLEALRLADRVTVMTGRPATVSAPLVPPGAAPRSTGDRDVLALQGALLERLAQC